MSTCAFTVCVSVKTGVKITVNFYVKIDVNFAVKAVNFYTVNFYSVNFRAVIFYDFSAFWGWKCWRIFLAVLDNGGAAHSGLLGNLGIRGFRMLGKVCEHFILLHLTGSLSVLTGALRSLAHAVSLAHRVDCRDVLVELPVRDGVDAGIIGDFLDIPNMIKTWLLQIAATLFNTYFGVINQTLDAKFISGPFNELFGTTEPYGVVKDFYQAGVIPVAHAILGLFMLMQLIKISQRIDATSTLPAVKDIVFLVVTYCILSYFIDNALDLVSAIYGIFNDLVGNVSDKLQSKNWYEPGIEMTKHDAADATFGGCFLLLIFGLISWAVGLVFYAVSMVVALGRSVQLYVYAAFSPIPISLLGFEETKQIGIGYLKNFAAAALAGVVMVLILYLYPHLVTALAVSGGLGKAEMLGLAQGVETFDSFGVIIKTIAVLITTMMGLVKSGSWAKEILGA